MTRSAQRLAAFAACSFLFFAFAQARAGESPWREKPIARGSSGPLTALRVVLDVGSIDDPPGKEGLAALTAAMVAEGGTRELTYDQVLEKLYPMAASVEGHCRAEATSFSGTVHRDHFSEYEALVAAMLTRPRFSPDDFARLQARALDGIAKSLRGNNDEELSKQTLRVSAYAGTPYGHVDAGTVQGLKAITLEDVKAFYAKYYVKGNIAFGLQGGEVAGAAEKLERDLSVLPAGKTDPPPAPEAGAIEGFDVTVVEKPADSTAIALGFPLEVSRADDAFYPLMVANSHLGEHRTFNGTLMRDLRGKRGLNYGDYSYIEDFIEDRGTVFIAPGNPRRRRLFLIWIRPVPHDKAAFALRAALWEYRKLTARGLSEPEFDRTRDFLGNYAQLWRQTSERALGFAMDAPFYRGRDLCDELAKRLPKITREQVNDAINTQLGNRGFFVAIVTRDAQALAEVLRSGKPTPIKYDSEGTPGDVLAEDKLIESLPLEKLRVKITPADQMFER